MNIAGFLEQARVVRTGVDAAIRQMRREDTGIVVEGVHLLPDVPTTIPDVGPVPVVMLAVLDEARHREHFLSRDREVAGRRPPGRYFRNFERIRAVQAHLVERANAAGVRVVDTSDRTVQETTREVLAAIGRG